jgi:hypothetical protein
MRFQYGWVLVVAIAACGPTSGGADSGGGGTTDASGSGADVYDPDRPDAPPCQAINVQADEGLAPVDIIWVIDNSGSMDEEEARVQNNINSFSATIANSGIDYRVVMITNTSHVNVPPPLGGSAELRAINQDVGSHDSLELIVATYPMWQDFLRSTSIKHFVAVTDDESDWSQGQFEAAIAGLTMPGFPGGFVFHAIVAEDPPWDFNSPCFTLAADIGQTYIDLQQDHGGVFYSLCLSDWTPVFTALSTSVIQGAELPCSYDIPDPPAGENLDYGRVNVVYTPSVGAPFTIPYVGSASDCGPQGGWYYDDPDSPTNIIVCPATCDVFEGDPEGQVDVAFGCGTIID